MLSGRLVTVIGRDRESTPEEEEALRIDAHRARPLQQRGRDVDRQIVVADGFVAGEILALEVGVDRHIEDAPSAERANEIER